MKRVCGVCRGTGYLYQFPDAIKASGNVRQWSYGDVKCWQCLGEKEVEYGMTPDRQDLIAPKTLDKNNSNVQQDEGYIDKLKGAPGINNI